MAFWYSQTQRDNSIGINKSGGRDFIVGHQNTSGGTEPTSKVSFSLAKVGTGGNGTLTARIYDTSINLKHTSTTTIDADSLSDSFQVKEFDFDGTVDCEDTWFVAIHTDGTSAGDNFALVGVYITTGDTEHVLNTFPTTLATYTDRLVTTEITGTPSPSSAVLLPPPVAWI